MLDRLPHLYAWHHNPKTNIFSWKEIASQMEEEIQACAQDLRKINSFFHYCTQFKETSQPTQVEIFLFLFLVLQFFRSRLPRKQHTQNLNWRGLACKIPLDSSHNSSRNRSHSTSIRIQLQIEPTGKEWMQEGANEIVEPWSLYWPNPVSIICS